MIYAVDLNRDESGWWIATVSEVPGCHTQGRSIRQAMARIREALEACTGDVVEPERLVPQVHLSAEVRKVVTEYESACRRLEREQEAARTATSAAVDTLVDGLALSVRDAGDILGLSHQRVSQLVKPEARS